MCSGENKPVCELVCKCSSFQFMCCKQTLILRQTAAHLSSRVHIWCHGRPEFCNSLSQFLFLCWFDSPANKLIVFHCSQYSTVNANSLKQSTIMIKEINLCSWLPLFCKQNLLFIQHARWQPTTYFFNHCNSLF